MATAAPYRPSPNGNSMPPQAMPRNGANRPPPNGRRPRYPGPPDVDGAGMIPPAPDAARVRAMSYRNNPPAVPGHRGGGPSFSARTREMQSDWNPALDGQQWYGGYAMDDRARPNPPSMNGPQNMQYGGAPRVDRRQPRPPKNALLPDVYHGSLPGEEMRQSYPPMGALPRNVQYRGSTRDDHRQSNPPTNVQPQDPRHRRSVRDDRRQPPQPLPNAPPQETQHRSSARDDRGQPPQLPTNAPSQDVQAPPESTIPQDGQDLSMPDEAPSGGDNHEMVSPMGSVNHESPLSRSSTMRSTKESRRDWAHDRSPLQKLEVKLTGLTKEEKRARALEAEMRLKERLAKPETDQSEPAQSQPREAPREDEPKPAALPDDQQPHHEHFASSGGPPAGRVPRGHTRAQSQNPEYSKPAIQSHREDPYAGQPPPGLGMNPNVGVRRRMTVGDQPSLPPVKPTPMRQGPLRDNNGPFPGHEPRGPPMPGPPLRSDTMRSSEGPMHYADNRYPQDRPIQSRQLPQQPQQPSRRIEPYPPMTGVLQQRGINVTDNNPSKRMESYPPSMGVYQQKGAIAVENPSSFSHSFGHSFGHSFINQEPNQASIQDPSVGDGERDAMTMSDHTGGTITQAKPKKPNVSFDMPPPTPPPLSEWRGAPVLKLELSDFDFQNLDIDRSKAWWEGGTSNDRRQSRVLPPNYQKPVPKTPEAKKKFQPRLFLQCGPLLRYTGIAYEKIDGVSGPIEKETWRGTILIVTKDSRSSYESPPVLRLFSQPMDLLPPPPSEVLGDEGAQLAPEYVDPIAGMIKLGRDGRPLYVKPVEDLEEGVDLSLIENEDGLYEQTPSALDYGAQSTIPASRIHAADGETAGIYKEIPGFRLHADVDRDVTFWRFNVEVELGSEQQRVAYRINQGPAMGFWVPARRTSMNIAFYSGNGFGLSAASDKVCGPDPLWRDILNEHQTRPFHVMIGGGDQISNDSILTESPHFQEWIRIKNTEDKYSTPFTGDFRAEVESFYMDSYSTWFSQGLFSLANSQIPMINMWNDHEIIQGFGSYSDQFMRTPVIAGLGKTAFKYYLLFQHHTVIDETEAHERSWLLGAQSGPYIREKSRNLFMSLGKDVTFLGLDCRTERTSTSILNEATCDLIWDRCHREIVKGETKHLIVLSSIPIAYPRVAMIKNLQNSRKSLGKAGMFGGLLNRHGGKVEISDDHWTAKHHKEERTWLIEDLQDLAAEKSVRVTILSGDVHLAAIGEFYSNPNLNIPKDRDYRYMPNVISSAMADLPETDMISDMLNRRNRVHHVDSNTDEDMIPIFTHDVDGKSRNNKRLLPRRNWCAIREYQPGTSALPTPESEMARPVIEPRPNKLQRTLSLTRSDRPSGGGGGLLRRLSLRGGGPPTKEFFPSDGSLNTRRMSMDGPFPMTDVNNSEGYFSQPPADAESRPTIFHRRPTNLSQKAARKAVQQGDDGVGAFVDLHGGLAITLNLEVNPRDPSGITSPYKLLVPVLRFAGDEYDPPATQITKGWRKWLGVRKKSDKSYLEQGNASDEEDDDHDDDDDDDDVDDVDDEVDNEDDDGVDGDGLYPPGYERYLGARDDSPEPEDIDVETKKPRKKWFGVV